MAKTYEDFRKMDKDLTLSDVILGYIKDADIPISATDLKRDLESFGFFDNEIIETLKELEKSGKIESRYLEGMVRFYGFPIEDK